MPHEGIHGTNGPKGTRKSHAFRSHKKHDYNIDGNQKDQVVLLGIEQHPSYAIGYLTSLYPIRLAAFLFVK